MIQRISKTWLYVMLIPLPGRLSTELLFSVLVWTFSRTNTGKGRSFFVERGKFCIFSLLFLYMLWKRISCAILVGTLGSLVDNLWLKSPPSNIILMNFISISRTDCTCLSINISPWKNSSFSSFSNNQNFAALERTRSFSSLDHVHAS